MVASTLVDLVKIVSNSAGTSAFVLGDAVLSFRGKEALIDGATYSYSVQQGSNYEYGTGVYNETAGTMSRNVLGSSNSDAPVPFDLVARIAFTLLAEDIYALGAPNFAIGTVTQGSTFEVELSGTFPNYVLNFTLVAGDTPSFTIGTVGTVAPNAAPTVTITGTAPDYVLNFGFPDNSTAAANAIAAAAAAALSETAAAISAGIAAAAVATPSIRVQANPATPTVPPSGAASGDQYWAVDASSLNLVLYLNTAGTGAPVTPAVSVPLTTSVTAVIANMSRVLAAVPITQRSRRVGVQTLTAGTGNYLAGHARLQFQAIYRTTITGAGMRVGGVGSGLVSIDVLSGDPAVGNMTNLAAYVLPAPVATGDKPWTGLSIVLQPGQWAEIATPVGGVVPVYRSIGAGRTYDRTPPLAVGASGAYTAAPGDFLEAYFDITEDIPAIPLLSMSADVQSSLSAENAVAPSQTVWTGFMGPLTDSASAFPGGAVDAILYGMTFNLTGPVNQIELQVDTVGSGAATLILARGPLAGLMYAVSRSDVTVSSTGDVTLNGGGADYTMDAQAGDHLILGRVAAGAKFSLAAQQQSLTNYFAVSPLPVAGLPLSFSNTSPGSRTKVRAKQTAHKFTPIRAQETPLVWDVFLTAGQSNMMGKPLTGGGPILPAGIAKQYYAGALTDILGDPVGNANTGSMCPAFALEYYRRTGRGIIFVPRAVDGSSLIPAATSGGGGYWGTGGASLLPAALAALNAALAAATAAGLAARYAGSLWMQGESDATDIGLGTPGVTKANYKSQFATMLASIESDQGYAAGTMPFYIFRIGTRSDGDPTGFQQIRAAQDELCKASPNVRMASIRAVNYRARGLMRDQFHFFQDGYDELGVDGAVEAAK